MKKEKKKVEWSKLFSALIALCFGLYGIWCGIEYYSLCKLAIQTGSEMPDVSLAVVCVTNVIASLICYLLYQAGLKNSRNKYGIDENGQPFREYIEDESENGESEMEDEYINEERIAE